MSDLYIIGAGCSRNYAQFTHGIKRLKSPLNRDFFKMARLVIENSGMKSDELFMDEIDHLINSIAPYYGSGERSLKFFDDLNLNLEEVMTLLDVNSKLFANRPILNPRQNEARELRILKDLLVRTLDYALEGPVCSKHLALADRMKAGDVVLSFNYDILMDNALLAHGRITDSAYGMNFFRVNQDGQWTTLDERPSQITILKLHGSLNWVRCGLCNSMLLFRYVKQTMYGAHTFQCPRCSADERHGIRMMVPPIQSKDYGDQDIAFLWFQTDRIMQDFSKIICIGYSFSPSDFDMISLMRRYQARRTKTPEVDFVSKDLKAERRMKSIFGVKKVTQFADLSSYLNSN